MDPNQQQPSPKGTSLDEAASAVSASSNPAIPVDPKAALADLEELTKDPVPTLAEEVAAFEDLQQAATSAQSALSASGGVGQSVTSGGKEMEPAYVETSAGKPAESVSEMEEIPEQPDVKELDGYVEKIEKAAETQQVVVDDYTKQVLLAPSDPQSAVVTLPLTADDIKKGLHHHIWEGIRWLAEWCVRQIKVLHGRVRFKK